MINKFLKAKHWQLFIFMFGIPFIFQILMMVTIFSNINSNENPDPKIFINAFSFLPIAILINTGALFGWFWSIAIGFQKYIPSNIKMSITRFKVFFFIPLVYLIAITLLIGGFLSQISQMGVDQSNVETMSSSIGMIFPLHILSMFGIFHSMYFAAKTFKIVELQKEVSFSEFAGEFFLLWFYFIGVWILQPKINKMFDELSKKSDIEI